MDYFYDRLAPLYDLIFLDWDASMEQQAGHLGKLALAHDATSRSSPSAAML